MKWISAIPEMITAPSSRRRLFLKLLGRGILGATAVAAGVGGIKRAQAAGEQFPPLWSSASVLVGNSPADQIPGYVITCPFFFPDDGSFAHAFHTLDLTNLPTSGTVSGSITHQNDIIYPDFSASMVNTVAQGSDGIYYLLSCAEGTLTGGTGWFKGVSKVIVRCKYKVTFNAQGHILLIACEIGRAHV